ncbi:amidohydrolase family protein [Luteolibacter pohnpeiensis]|uniref:Amidohydrolase family protein n=1 Tax=Luteolibacter pohnpeiensis TaxID=454153 RepID=A0A934S2Q8_9BACT|nr:amidohydrolase family protein [Luteolibacter pohnpeiensis]MBK1881252.1 amidohydrolase family protein [Luteolibacter pohnpeiensis]
MQRLQPVDAWKSLIGLESALSRTMEEHRISELPNYQNTVHRRGFIVSSLSAGVALGAGRLFGAEKASAKSEEYVLSGATLLSQAGNELDGSKVDIHVKDGAIFAIAASIEAPGVSRIDLSGTLVMPGFVDTHWHMWNTIARGIQSSAKGDFFATQKALAKTWTAEASGVGVRLALAEAVNSGITTVNNWAHNVRAREFADAELEAQLASGVRGRFSYGYPQDIAEDEVMDVDSLAATQKRLAELDNPLIHLGLCVRGPDRCEEKVWRAEWEAARSMKLPLTTHIASTAAKAANGSIRKLHQNGLLGPDIQLVHATHAKLDDFKLIADAGSPLSISPWTELEVGYGLPPLLEIAKSGVELGLSVDNMVLAGRADMFEVMKITADLAAGLATQMLPISLSKVVSWATIGGARGLQLGEQTGSLEVGKRADLIAVRTDRLNTSPVGSAEFMLTHSANPASVDFVMIDGKIHKQGGRLAKVDLPALLEESQTMISSLKKSAGL